MIRRFLRRLWYRFVYLRSAHWQRVRRRALARAHYACEDCGKANTRLDVHHVSYARLWRERPADLRVVCRGCHVKRHGKIAAGEK